MRAYHNKGISPAHIGTLLRDEHLIDVKSYIKENYNKNRLLKVFDFLNYNFELTVANKRVSKLENHLFKNKKDYSALKVLRTYKSKTYHLSKK